MTYPALIGIYSSRPQCGKSTLAGRLERHHNYKRLRFASALKGMLHVLLSSAGLDEVDEYLDGSKKEIPIPQLGGKTARYLMQTLGTEWGRALISPNLWVEVTKAAIQREVEAGRRVVVDDMRFAGEYEAIITLGGKLIRVEREVDFPIETPANGHPSEGALNGRFFHELIVNDSTLGRFRRKIDQVTSRLVHP